MSQYQKRTDRVSQVYDEAFDSLYNSFIEELERKETGDTIQAWLSSPIHSQPINAATGNFYKGINNVLLEKAINNHLYETDLFDNRFIGFAQAKDMNLKMKKGSKAIPVLFYQTERNIESVDESTGEVLNTPQKLANPRRIYHNVFHMSCFENAPPPPQFDNLQSPFARHELIEQFLKNTPAEIVHTTGSKCFYAPDKDKIYMVEPERFKRIEDYYGVALHEKTHASGHPNRLNIATLTANNSDKVSYAKEELRAELGATMLMRKLHIALPLKLDSNYILMYLKQIPQDQRRDCFIDAVYQANRSSDFLIDSAGIRPEIEAFEQEISNIITTDLKQGLEQDRKKDLNISSRSTSFSIA